MCGRFNVIDSPGLQQLLKSLGIDLSLPTRVNVAPTEMVPLAADRGAERSLDQARWWLTPSWAASVDQKYAMFNARSEGLAKSRAFARPFKCQRGLVPMSGFIEWRTEEGVKSWLVTNADKALAVAALWDVWEKGEEPLLTCTLLTTAAAPAFRSWHSRMPVLLSPQECDRWLDNTHQIASDDAIFRADLKAPLHLQRLSRAVSNSRNKDVSLMRPGEDATVITA